MAIIPIKGLFEAHLTVSDLERSIAFYRDVVGLELAHTVPERHAVTNTALSLSLMSFLLIALF